MKAILLLGTAALFAAPAAAHAQAAMPGMDMAPTAPPKEPAPIPAPVDDHAAHTAPAEPAPDQADPHAGHDPAAQPKGSSDMNGMAGMPSMSPADTQIGTAPAPAPPADHAADALFDPAAMALSRRNLRRENGAFSGSMILFDLAEF